MASISTVKTTSAAKRMALAAACTLGVTSAALSAHHAEAQTARPAAPHMAPGQSVEIIAPAATITSTVHYQALLKLTCGGLSCSGNFRQPGAHHQLNVTRVSCYIEGGAGSAFEYSVISLYSASNVFLLQEFLPVNSSSPAGYHLLNRAVDLQLVGSQHMTVALLLSSTASNGYCAATGTLSTLG